MSRNAITLTPSLAYASGQDAGNASMRKAGRTRWNEDDHAVACDVTNRLLLALLPDDVADEIRQRLAA